MRGLFWILALFGLAVGLSLAARYNDGYVLFFVPPKRIELSLTLFLLLLAGNFGVLYFFLRAAIYTLGLPERVKAFRTARTLERARHSLFDAMRALFEGRYARAERAAGAAHAAGEEAALAALLAAQAAHRLENRALRDAWLVKAAAATREGSGMALNHARLMAEAEMLVDDRRDAEALQRLEELNRSGARHIATQRLALKAMTNAGRWEASLSVARQLEERKAVHPAVAARTREAAYAALFAQGDAEELRERLKRMPRADRRTARVAATVAQGLIGACLMHEAQAVIETALQHEWNSALAAQYADCVATNDRDVARQLEQAERWLDEHPGDAGLLLALGRLCARQQLWGKAQNILEQAAVAAPSRAVWLELARLMESSGQGDAAHRYFRMAAEADD